KELCDIVRAEHYDVVGLSAACDACLDDIEDEIAALRDAACNPDLKILVGGRVFTESPDLASTIGADAAANDAKAAPAVGRKLLAVSRLSC
ncbi:MAG: cobalamin-binding protein, partial [Hyphococcus sp.]